MREYPNFYESINEAQIRLHGTIVLYAGMPYVVWWISSHWSDGIFRIYLNPLNDEEDEGDDDPDVNSIRNTQGEAAVGPYLDKWLSDHPNTRLIRKKLSSAKFNRFQPFPLGMVNQNANCFYVQRQPVRKTEQGLCTAALDVCNLSLIGKQDDKPKKAYSLKKKQSVGAFDPFTGSFEDCILGKYPTAGECLTNLVSPNIVNNAVAFHRHFALVRGPVDTLFLAHNTDIIASLPFLNFEVLKISRDFVHLRETIDELGLFHDIVYQN